MKFSSKLLPMAAMALVGAFGVSSFMQGTEALDGPVARGDRCFQCVIACPYGGINTPAGCRCCAPPAPPPK